MDSVIYVEVMGMASDKDGNPVPAGMEINMGDISQGRKIPYDALVSAVKLPALFALFGLDFDPRDITVITREDYLEKYGEQAKEVSHSDDEWRECSEEVLNAFDLKVGRENDAKN
ncbi:hypothetical protein [Ethanoligenens sp.]|uniref:hypothetical protein n=1 Tax=Ethanoligenens sp. TaxID=2099655 RepID=UPI0039E9390F